MVCVYLDFKKINKNIKVLTRKLKHFVIVTKCLKLNDQILNSIDLGDRYVYDTSLENLKLLKRKKINLLYEFKHFKVLKGKNDRIIVSTLSEIYEVLKTDIKQIYLNFDFGDKRDGLNIKDIKKILEILVSDKKTRYYSIMSNIGCFCNTPPDKTYFEKFLKIKKLISISGIEVAMCSVGGSNCIPSTLGGGVKISNYELRIGEAIFLGSIPYSDFNFGLQGGTSFLVTNFRRTSSIISDVGYNLISKESLNNVKILRQSSENTAISLNFSNFCVDNKLYLPLSYHGLSRISKLRHLKYITSG